MVEKEKMIKGEIYTITDIKYPGKRIIHKFEKMSDEDRSYGYYMDDFVGEWELTKSTPYLLLKDIKIATYEEKQWLEECIKRNTFVPFEKLTFKKQIHELW